MLTSCAKELKALDFVKIDISRRYSTSYMSMSWISFFPLFDFIYVLLNSVEDTQIISRNSSAITMLMDLMLEAWKKVWFLYLGQERRLLSGGVIKKKKSNQVRKTIIATPIHPFHPFSSFFLSHLELIFQTLLFQ